MLLIGATVLDKKFRACDKTAARLLWKLDCPSRRTLRQLLMKFADGSTLADSGTRALPGVAACTWLSPCHNDKCMLLAASTA